MASFHVYAGATNTLEHPAIRRITVADVFDALRRGFDDFWDKPSHYVFLCLIYPIVGVFLITWTSGGNALQLIFPLMSGFALLGPFAGIGLYEISRRREQNLDTSWRHAFDVRLSPAIPAMVAIGIMLLVLFVAWLLVAQGLYAWLYGADAPQSTAAFFEDLFTTQRGWTLIVLGNLIGFLFALVVLCTTVVAFPLLLDCDVGAYAAVETSVRAVQSNPVPMLLWGLIVAVALLIGSLPFLAGLAVVIPVLGHATWHLYRKVVDVPADKKTPLPPANTERDDRHFPYWLRW
ncbi:DUF2189 domain-containing protein [Aminobacter aganoensis]|uniref:Putative membrane protein n=1 Tax=Aminobacter aganoensis TaxID=83264 RepID=A0A7X0KMC2_9HYPH|nr:MULTISPECIES: DUF2189 domain-containing protein [Aminobacter]KQU74689.1 cytochrome C oxidase subunit I [Aminobacter sp. DSM 101952]MBB6355981.1 putative membrane protein [Aminobacter aganoensis]